MTGRRGLVDPHRGQRRRVGQRCGACAAGEYDEPPQRRRDTAAAQL